MAALQFPPEVLLQAQGRALGMKAAIFDVDGVLTDGRIYIGEQGETVKAFSTLDGQGLQRLRQGGIDGQCVVAHEVMHPRPHLIRAGALAVDAADLMERHRITSVLVVDAEGALVGALNTYDLLRAKVI